MEDVDSPSVSVVSLKSDKSIEIPLNFKEEQNLEAAGVQQKEADLLSVSDVSIKSDASMENLLNLKDGQNLEAVSEQESSKKYPSNLQSLFKLLEQNIITLVKTELQNLQESLTLKYEEDAGVQRPEEKLTENQEEKGEESSRDNLMKIIMNGIRSIGDTELADYLHNRRIIPSCQQKVKARLRKKFKHFSEGIGEAGKMTHLNDIYTELYIVHGGIEGVNAEHEVRQIETASRSQSRPEHLIRCEDIFQPFPGRENLSVRTVLTKGVAGIGKTVLTRKFALDWAEGKANANVHFTFPLTFRELNMLSGKIYSLVELLHLFFMETKEATINSFDNFNYVFILDGLDECRLPMDFHNNEIVTDVTKLATVDVLLTNLITGKLLPNARLWITSRPAAAGQIPLKCVDLVTEVRGFTDEQKKEYFEKRFRGGGHAERIISHVKTSRTLHIMCHIPVFCWITASVLESVMEADGELPQTLTEMYIHFLVVQVKLGFQKYHGVKSDSFWSMGTCKVIMSLGKLAFEQLKKGNLIFYDSDLMASDIDITTASAYSGLLTQIFKEESGLYQNKLYCFVHLSFQEFLAALYVYVKFINDGDNLLAESQVLSTSWWNFWTSGNNERTIFQDAVDKALENPNGFLDLFVRFLLGLSLQRNQTLLWGLLKKKPKDSVAAHHAAKYIKDKIHENPSPESCINLFYCLNELQDNSLVNEIQQSLCSGSLSMDMQSPAQWSAVVFVLLSSEKDLEEFDLRNYSASEKALLQLLPVLKQAKRVTLNGCRLGERSCEALASVLQSRKSNVRVLDLSNNDLKDSGVKLLSSGIGSPHCKLEVLSLAGCQVMEKGCAALASALNSNPCHLKELDLSYNNPGDLGIRLLSAAVEDPRLHLTALSFQHDGVERLKPGPKKFACKLTLDPNTANCHLSLSGENSKVAMASQRQPYSDHPERFHHWKQVLCREGLTGRCYWEVDWEGWVDIGVAYRGIGRKRRDDDCWIGQNERSWSLFCCDKFSACHMDTRTVISTWSPFDSGRVGVFLDWPSGCLSFYRVSAETHLSHIHSFRCKFTEPLYPAFGLQSSEATVSLRLP